MGPNQLFVFSNPTPNNDDEFNNWYDNVHLPEILALCDMPGAKRYVVGPRFGEKPTPAHRYLAIYDLGDDAKGTLQKLIDNRPKLTQSDAMDYDSVQGYVYIEIPS